MKICHVAAQVFAINDELEYGGLEQVVFDLATEQAKAGHEVTVVAPKGSRIEGCDIIETIEPKSEWGKEEEVAYPIYHDKLIDFDVVLDHTHHYLPYLAKTKAICHLAHGLQTAIPPTVFNMITLSEFHRELTQQNFGKDSKVVTHGIDLDKYKVKGDKEDYFVCASILLDHKNHISAIYSCAEAGVRLKVIGEHEFGCDPKHVEWVMQECEESGADFIGRVSAEDKIKYLGEAKGVLLPFTFPEATSLLLMESNAVGSSVIVSKIGGIPEIMVNGVNGYMITGLKDLTERIKIIDGVKEETYQTISCRLHAEQNFDRKRMAKDHLEIFEEAVGGSRW